MNLDKRTKALALASSVLASLLVGQPQWTLQTSGVTARLRGVSATSDRVAWASGSSGALLRTANGGATWQKLTVTTDTDGLFEISMQLTTGQLTFSVSAMVPRPASTRLPMPVLRGLSNTEVSDPKMFLDAMSFWDVDHGIVMGDSIDGQFCILITENGGRAWTRVPAAALPPALANEGAFAASGTNIAVVGKTNT